MAGNIFISYRRDDARADARNIRDRLAQAFGEKHIFMDVDNLKPGQRFDQELAKVLQSCEVFLAVIGPRWLETLAQREKSGERDYVREEIATALKRGVHCIPVVIEGATLPAPARVPADVRDLVMHHKVDVGHATFGRDMAILSDSVGETIGKRPKGGGRDWPALAGAAKPVLLNMAKAIAAVFALVYAYNYYDNYSREQARVEAEQQEVYKKQRDETLTKQAGEQKRFISRENYQLTHCFYRDSLENDAEFGSFIACDVKSSNKFESGDVYVCGGALYGQDGAARGLSAIQTGKSFMIGQGQFGIDVGNGLTGTTLLLFKSPAQNGPLQSVRVWFGWNNCDKSQMLEFTNVAWN